MTGPAPQLGPAVSHITQRIQDITADLNRALAIANDIPGLIARVGVLTVLPATAGQPYAVTVNPIFHTAGQAASTQEAATP